MTGDTDPQLPGEDDSDLRALVDRYVVPGRRYPKLLHGNFLRLPDDELAEFTENLRHDADAIADHDVGVPLSYE